MRTTILIIALLLVSGCAAMQGMGRALQNSGDGGYQTYQPYKPQPLMYDFKQTRCVTSYSGNRAYTSCQ